MKIDLAKTLRLSDVSSLLFDVGIIKRLKYVVTHVLENYTDFMKFQLFIKYISMKLTLRGVLCFSLLGEQLIPITTTSEQTFFCYNVENVRRVWILFIHEILILILIFSNFPCNSVMGHFYGLYVYLKMYNAIPLRRLKRSYHMVIQIIFSCRT